MNQQDLVQSFIERCKAGAATKILTARFQDGMEQLGFRYFSICSHVDPLNPPPHAITVHNYPHAWMQIYSEQQLYDIDPILQRAEQDPLPFFWDGAFRTHPVTGPQVKILLEAEKFGIAHGFTIPIHLSWMPGCLRASCSVVPAEEEVDSWNYRIAELMANHLFVALMQEQAPWKNSTTVKLTDRERQCLSLAAEGKDDWSIGQLLRLSKGTVHTYVERAKQRYGVATRMQAVVQALAGGQISFGEPLRLQNKSPFENLNRRVAK
ncbi:MAG: LuxR family transcriptional regulator [Steroidobacteraceae bacterium]